MNTCQDDLQDLFGVSGRDHRVSRLPAPGSSSGSPQAKSWNNRQPPPNFPHQRRTQVSVVASFLCSILRNIHLRTKTHSFVFPFHLFLTSCIFVTFQHVSCPLAILLLFDGWFFFWQRDALFSTPALESCFLVGLQRTSDKTKQKIWDWSVLSLTLCPSWVFNVTHFSLSLWQTLLFNRQAVVQTNVWHVPKLNRVKSDTEEGNPTQWRPEDANNSLSRN